MKRPESSLDHEMVSAWHEAASALGLRLQAPYRLDVDGKESFWVEGFLPDFGRRGGMVFVAVETGQVPTELFVSKLSPTYRTYDRDDFIATLNDWGWYRASQDAPEWYTGEPWG